MKACDPEGPVMIQVAKLYQTTDAQSFRAFGRVLSGTLRKGHQIKVLGEGYSPEDEEDMMKATVENLWIYESRFEVHENASHHVLKYSVDIISQRMRFPLATSS